MKPAPASKHILSIIIFAAVAVAGGYLAWQDDRFSDEQLNFAAAAARRHDPDLMKYDSVYGEVHAQGRLRELHTPVFLSMMEMVLTPTGYTDLLLPFRVMAGVVAFLYLCGMYALLWRQCRSSTIAAFVAILSMAVTRTFGDWFWGVGSLASITPQGIVIAVSPLILLSFLENARRPRLVLTFMAIGLCGNLHLISAVNLGLVLLIVYLGRNRFRWSAIIKGAGCVVFFVLGTLPYLLYFLVMKHNISANMPVGASESTQAVLDALRLSNLAVLYPEMLKSLLQWALYLSVLVLLSGIMLWKSDRFTSRDVGVWVWMMAAGCVVALGFHGISQALGMLLGEAPPFIDFPQAACWVMLAAYALFAQALTLLFRMVRSDKNKRYLRWACAAFLLIWMLPSDNLRVFRHMTYRLATIGLDDRVQELADDADEQAELAAIADWARQNQNQNTDIDAVFLTDQEQFRCLARRSIFVNRDDIRHFYYLTPWMLGQWTDQLRKQSRWLGDPINADEIISGVGGLRSRESYRNVPQWYVLLSARARLKNPGRLEEQTSPAWGQHWRVFKIPPP